MMVGNGLTVSSRGKATLWGTKVQIAMVLQTHKCMMVIVCQTHPEKKIHDTWNRRIATNYSGIFTVRDIQ